MRVCIDHEVLRKYPEAEIGYLVANVSVKRSDTYVEALKLTLGLTLQEEGLDVTNFAAHPKIASWKRIFKEDFQVKDKSYRSSVEALVRRLLMGKEIWNISSVVDLYNCCSLLSLLPMGGYDLHKIAGDVAIRFAKEGELFQGLGDRVAIPAHPREVVYADAERLICWLWNYKDAAETSIDEHSSEVLFFVDSMKQGSVSAALDLLSGHLRNIACQPTEAGILNRLSPEAVLKARQT